MIAHAQFWNQAEFSSRPEILTEWKTTEEGGTLLYMHIDVAILLFCFELSEIFLLFLIWSL